MNAKTASIAIVGMSCIYPDARAPVELWENVLAQRRAFRRMPPERLRLEDFFSSEHAEPDKTYATEAALIEGYEFDRVGFRVAGSTFRSADLAHWLALDVAARALADAGFPGGKGLPQASAGVLLGNSLTGEFSRASAMRLRWPYVRRTVDAALARKEWSAQQRGEFLDELETQYKSPFPPVGEETLAGSLSNTIAGRICNHFDLKGGGYTIDAACASSLLAVANACSALAIGDLEVAIAGGVDLSLDPFELVGFAKAGALAAGEMRVFDRRSAGFWPGEGCGMVVLMRHDDALAQGRRVYAVIRGWGISSDGRGGITRPELDGQLESLRRAYRRAAFGLETVSYVEAHGTGTAVGDAVELEAISRARREAGPDSPPAAIGSIKANIGHTKAAAGVAGLIKATMAVHTQVLPPTTACETPHEKLEGPLPALRVLNEPEPWPEGRELRACVNAMGFGGINTHVVLESALASRRNALSPRERSFARSHQDAELFLFSAENRALLAEQSAKVAAIAPRISRAELTDLAAELARRADVGKFRAGIVANAPAELADKLQILWSWLAQEPLAPLKIEQGIYFGAGDRAQRIGLLFPGQASPMNLDGGMWRRRFDRVRELYTANEFPAEGLPASTRIMQPAIVVASLAGLDVLQDLGIGADCAIGHSLGEMTALHWAGALDRETLLRLARVRGAAMAELGAPNGVMLAVVAPPERVAEMLNGEPLAIVGYNSPRQTVVAGDAEAVHCLAQRASAQGMQTVALAVSHAFHTPLVAAATPVLAEQLARENFAALRQPVFSTVTGAMLESSEDLRDLLCRQVTSPVRFLAAFKSMCRAADVFIEVGPGSVLAGLARDATAAPVISLDAGGASLRGCLEAAGLAFASGGTVRTEALFADRFTRPFALDWRPKFFVNPCELAPVTTVETPQDLNPALASRPARVNASPASAGPEAAIPQADTTGELKPLELIRELVAERAELPLSAVRDDYRMLADLHLNSISVGQIVSEAARRLGMPRMAALTDFANARVAEIAQALDDLRKTGRGSQRADPGLAPAGVDSWVRLFVQEVVEVRRPRRTSKRQKYPAATEWQVFAHPDQALAEPLRDALRQTGISGVAIWLSKKPDERDISLLLDGGRAALAMKERPRLLVVQYGCGGGGFARTLRLERTDVAVCIVNLPLEHSRAIELLLAEAAATDDFTEIWLGENGRRFEKRLKLAETPSTNGVGKYPVGAADVLLVTGGGKGIAAECALKLAHETGVNLAILGRSDPNADPELARNLARFEAAGISATYAKCDVTDARAVRGTVAWLEQKLGPVTGILHGAGVNTPRLIGQLDEAAFRRTLGPKVDGARNVLAAVDARKLRMFVVFGSIIARTGLPGEADYATANEWLAELTRKIQKQHPHCRCLALEWSVWSGTGMGERLGRIEALRRQGITPITVDQGVETFCTALRCSLTDAAVVATGRFGAPPTLKLLDRELPLRRFLERKRVFYPGVELIADAELSLETDPYLKDHAMQNQPLLPAVVGLEAIAQAAMALAETGEMPVFEKVRFVRPISLSKQSSLTIRLAALRRQSGEVEVCLRSEETDFQADHFRAVCRFGAREKSIMPRLALSSSETKPLALDPENELYGRILFHQGRFRRLRGYHLLNAKKCMAEITPNDVAPWFCSYMPAEFALGDPAARDAALHAIQACIPHQRVLPAGIERMAIRQVETGPRFVRAKERWREGKDFVYDVEITNDKGELIEYWDGLQLRAVENFAGREAWPEVLLGPYLERRLEELVADVPVKVAFERGLREVRPASTDEVILQALGKTARIWRRPDGKPLFVGDEGISAAHANDFTLAVSAAGGAACDLQEVSPRAKNLWQDLLNDDSFRLAERMAVEHAESLDIAATRVWTACECLKKIGQPVNSPMVLEAERDDVWAVLRAGAITIASGVLHVRGLDARLAVAVALRPPTAAQVLRAATQSTE